MRIDPDRLFQAIIPLSLIARGAGDILMKHYARLDAGGVDVSTKYDGSVVTTADNESETFILAELKRVFPDIPVIAEEAVSRGEIPDISGGVFITVDPLDGTKEFLNKTGGFVVAIGIVVDGRAAAGVIYHPVFNTLYCSFGPHTATIIDGRDVTRTINVRQPSSPPRVLLNARHGDHEAVFNLYTRIFNDGCTTRSFRENTQDVCNLDPQSGIFRFCQIAQGTADLFAFASRAGQTLTGGHWWDTVPGQAIVESAGGHVVDFCGKPISYDSAQANAPFYSPPYVIAGSEKMLENIRKKEPPAPRPAKRNTLSSGA